MPGSASENALAASITPAPKPNMVSCVRWAVAREHGRQGACGGGAGRHAAAEKSQQHRGHGRVHGPPAEALDTGKDDRLRRGYRRTAGMQVYRVDVAARMASMRRGQSPQRECGHDEGSG
jgi:hypothetical protein